MSKKIGSVLISGTEIQEKVKEIAEKVAGDYKGEVVFVTVLTGAKIFCSDLIKEINRISDLVVKNYFIKLSSYGKETTSSGKVKVVKDIEGSVDGKDVLIIEDIVDTGTTLSFLKEYLLETKKATSVKICSFLDKPSRRKVNVEIDYKGYEVPDEFIVGYGLDYAEKYRELKDISILVDE